MSEEKQEKIFMPRLDDLFFAVCATGIKNCAWKYADFEKVKVVEGQLQALHAFFIDFYQQEELAKQKEKPAPAEQPANDKGVDIEMPKPIADPVVATPAPVKPAPAEQEKKN